MAGYFLYTIDNDVFTQLTTSPTSRTSACGPGIETPSPR